MSNEIEVTCHTLFSESIYTILTGSFFYHRANIVTYKVR